jgi:hypothetical protein
MLDELNRDRRAVSYNRRPQVRRQVSGDLKRGRPAVQNHHLSRPDHPGARLAQCNLLVCGEILASGEVHHRRRGWQSSSVNTLQKPFLCQFSQVSPDRVLRQTKALAQRLGNDLALLGQLVEDQAASLAGQPP